ncbi:uncharacterized protein G2W53_017835 [Senna tora]|uniref:Uncharacterized protein n=1 Tax=Senna tora TaxID=362788 RepID=A0A834WPD2_9FABA|nr:uncharacterized protein G2W53_017835 [Senna tora]
MGGLWSKVREVTGEEHDRTQKEMVGKASKRSRS